MKTFLTETLDRYVGPNIRVNTWKEAELKANEIGLKVVGILVSTTYIEENKVGKS